MKKQCPKIIIIEDDKDIRESMELLLDSEGYGVESFADGRAALARLHKSPEPCLVFLDMLMPIMNGWEFMEEFKKHPATIVPIPVYLCSASATKEDSKIMGCRGFIKKPFDLTLLIHIVEKYCETEVKWDQSHIPTSEFGTNIAVKRQGAKGVAEVEGTDSHH
jgi:CheY-like chemotaxis protein